MQTTKGRPKWKPEDEKFTERYTVLVVPAMKKWIAEHGGGAYLRRLVEEGMNASVQDGGTQAAHSKVNRKATDAGCE